MGLRHILIGMFLCAGVLLKAQLVFTQLPASLQFFPGDSAGVGRFSISGKNTSHTSCQLKSRLVDASDHALVTEEKTITLSAGQNFYIRHFIPAQIKEFDLLIYQNTGKSDSLLKTINRLVCGDCFMICGQSNALAAADWGDTANTRPWLRGIGTNDNPAAAAFPCEMQDLAFSQASPGWTHPGYAGTWGMKLAYDISRHAGVPVCMINGARAGSSILQNFASHTPSDMEHLDSCNGYDRTYLKAARNNLNSHVRALFWYQGETDGEMTADSVLSYRAKFNRLYTSWKYDYPNIEKIILMQLNTGCSYNKNLSLLREVQRRISYDYPDVLIMSTFSTDTADRAGDLCHYTQSGYKKLADRLLPLVRKYIYKENLNGDDILPPKIVKAYASKASQLCLEFDKAVSVQPFTQYRNNTVYIKDYFYGGSSDTLRLESVIADENRVLLNFKQGDTLPAKITYLPQSLTNIPSLYTGPWILNAKNATLPALSFYEFPVTANSSANNWPLGSSNLNDNQKAPVIVKDKGFLAFPNPAKNEITINFPIKQIKGNTVLLIDAQGKTVLEVKSDNDFYIRLNVSGFEPGMYLLRISGAIGVYVQKVVLE